MSQNNTEDKNKEEIEKIDPTAKKPTQDIEQNLAEGIDEVIPDPDDIPGGVNPDLTSRPDLADADSEANISEKEMQDTSERKQKK